MRQWRTSKLLNGSQRFPKVVRASFEAAVLNAFETSSLPAACTSVLRPVFRRCGNWTAFSPSHILIAELAHRAGPAMVALLPIRRQSSLATCRRDTVRSSYWPMIRSSFAGRLRSETRCRNGDCSSSHGQSPAARRPSKTSSPVLLAKSAMTIVSFSIRGASFAATARSNQLPTAANRVKVSPRTGNLRLPSIRSGIRKLRPAEGLLPPPPRLRIPL